MTPPPPEPPVWLAVAFDLAWPLLIFDACWLATCAVRALETLTLP